MGKFLVFYTEIILPYSLVEMLFRGELQMHPQNTPKDCEKHLKKVRVSPSDSEGTEYAQLSLRVKGCA